MPREVMKALIPWNKGKKLSPEHCQKLSAGHGGRQRPWRLGMKHSEEAKRKMSESLKGRPAWNKGKKTGVVPWNKGKKCPEISIKMIGNKNGQGRRRRSIV